MAEINAKKISDLTLQTADPQTDFFEISRDNGDGTYTSYRSSVADAGGGGTGEEEMVGEVRWFGQDPGAKWLPLDGSEIDLATYPDVAASSMIRTLQAGDLVSATKTASSISTGVVSPTKIAQIANTDTIMVSRYFSNEVTLVDALNETVKDIPINLDGVGISTQSTVYSFLDDGIDTYFLLEDGLSGTFVMAKTTGLVTYADTSVELTTTGAVGFAPSTAGGRFTGFEYDGSRFYVCNFISSALWYSDDGGATFNSIPFSAIFACGYDSTFRPAFIGYYGGHLIFNSDLYVGAVSVADLNKVIAGDDISRPGIIISEYAAESEGTRADSIPLNKTSGSYIVDRIQSSDLKLFSVPYTQDSEVYYPGVTGDKYTISVPCGFGFLQVQNTDGDPISIRYVDELGATTSVDTDVSGTADDGTGHICFSTTQDKIFAFHDTVAASFDSMNVYSATISDVEKTYLRNVRDIDGAKAYLKVTV